MFQLYVSENVGEGDVSNPIFAFVMMEIYSLLVIIRPNKMVRNETLFKIGFS
jgi:hypothetical protein